MRTVVLSGASRTPVKGRLSCSVMALFCRSRATERAAEICSFVMGLRGGKRELDLVPASPIVYSTGLEVPVELVEIYSSKTKRWGERFRIEARRETGN